MKKGDRVKAKSTHHVKAGDHLKVHSVHSGTFYHVIGPSGSAFLPESGVEPVGTSSNPDPDRDNDNDMPAIAWEIAMDTLVAKVNGPPPGPHPPYTIHKIGGKFFVKNSLGMKKNSKGYATEAQAQSLQKALYVALPPEMKK